MIQDSNVLVTGGAGFLGANLTQALLQQGNRVICMDNFLTSSPVNIALFKDNSNFTLFEHDITEPFDHEQWGSLDYIFNLACPASPPHYQYDPIYTMKICVHGLMNMLELARTHNCPILQASTSEVYGDPSHSPQAESYRGNVNPIGRRACYDEGKRAGETLCFDYYREKKVNVKVIRIFNTYGPNMHPYDGRVVSNFILQALNNEDITIYGEGQQTRSFCYVDDLIRGMQKMITSDDTIHGPVNLGNPNEMTIKQLAEKIIELTNSKSKLIYKPLPADDPTQRRPDIQRANDQLDWRPVIQLDEGLTHTIEYFSKIDLTDFKPPTPGEVIIES